MGKGARKTKQVSLSAELQTIAEAARGIRGLVRQWIDTFGLDPETPNWFAVAVTTDAPKTLYVTAVVSASLGRATRFGSATVLKSVRRFSDNERP